MPKNTRDKRRTIEVVREYLAGGRTEEELTAKQEKYIEEVRYCLGLLLKGYPQTTVIEMIEEELTVSYSKAWRLIKETEEIFGPQGEVDKRFRRYTASEMAKEAYAMAMARSDPKSMIAATNAYVKAWGLDRDDPELPDFSKLDTPANILVIPDEVAEKLNALPAGGAINLTSFLESIAEDVEQQPAGPARSAASRDRPATQEG